MHVHDEGNELAWERACVTRARSGDTAAFAALYRRFAPRLYSHVLLPKLGDPQAAEDALAETFRVLLEQLSQLDAGERSLFPWLCRVATNKAIDMHRSRARSQRALCNFESLLAPLRVEPEETTLHELDRGRAELRSAVARVLSELSPRYRRALELRFLEERPREQCAQLLELKLGTFDVLVLRALRAFRRQWLSQATPKEHALG